MTASTYKGIQGVTQMGNTSKIQSNYVQKGQFITVPNKG